MKKLHNILLILIGTSLIFGCASIQEAESLYNKGDKEAALNMAISLLDKDDRVRLRAVRLIGKVGGEKAGSALRMRIRDADSKVQKEVIKNLGKIQYEPAMEDLVDLVAESDDGLARVIGGAFANYGEPGIDMLVERYEDPSEQSNRRAFKQTLIITLYGANPFLKIGTASITIAPSQERRGSRTGNRGNSETWFQCGQCHHRRFERNGQ